MPRASYYWRQRYPAWLWPRVADVLPFLSAQQVGANLANSRGRFAEMEPAERARRLVEIARAGGKASWRDVPEEQRRDWARAAARLGNAARWGSRS